MSIFNWHIAPKAQKAAPPRADIVTKYVAKAVPLADGRWLVRATAQRWVGASLLTETYVEDTTRNFNPYAGRFPRLEKYANTKKEARAKGAKMIRREVKKRKNLARTPITINECDL